MGNPLNEARRIAAIGAFILQPAFRDAVDHNKKNGTSELLRWEFDFFN
jgi:hypothetical protein